MKKGLFILCLCFLSLSAFAQATVRKVPFLPYIGGSGGTRTTEEGASSQTKQQTVLKITFKRGSSSLSKAAKAAIKRIESTCGGDLVSLKGYYSHKVTQELTKARQEAIRTALEDLGVHSIFVESPSFRNDSDAMVNLNQIIVSY